MRFLLLSSLFICLLSSCHFGHYGKLKEVIPNSNEVPKSMFGNDFNSYLFKTNITIYGKNYSGLLITKQIKENDYRVIFTTELGMKLFDFEFKDSTFTMHYCVPQFNRPKLLQTIKHDIETLLMLNIKNKPSVDLAKKYVHNIIKRVDLLDFTYYYYQSGRTFNLYKIEKAKKRRKKTTFMLNDYVNEFPSNIIIQHHDIKLKIELIHLKKE